MRHRSTEMSGHCRNEGRSLPQHPPIKLAPAQLQHESRKCVRRDDKGLPGHKRRQSALALIQMGWSVAADVGKWR